MAEMFNPTSIALHMFNAAIMGVAIYFLLYKPVRAFMAKRSGEVQAQIDEAAAMRAQAEALTREGERIIEDARRKAEETIAQSASAAQARADEITGRAMEEANRLREDALADALKTRVQAREALRDETAALAVMMAEKLIGRGMTDEDHARLVDALIEGL
ncbi:MAG: F0F1 ATP synthase subunit B [Oscillospiraceae bacterium]|jgi:F-type H+-transporting ATPase subunit b|nr:F0F1 ATP synthase subunit B [Oscillospiraceae bacterium]